MSRTPPAGAAALSLWLAACQGDPVTLCPLATDTPVFASAELSGDPLARLPLGHAVEGREPGRLDRKDRWRIQQGDALAWAAREALVTCPMLEHDAYVIAPTTVRLDRPGGAGGVGLDRLSIGAHLRVARGLSGVPESVVTVLHQGLPIGFVAAADVGEAPPDGPRLLAAAREAVSKGDLPRARELAKAASAAESAAKRGAGEPLSGPSSALLAALDNALAGAPITLPPAVYVPATPVTAPGPAWIAAASAGAPLRPDSPLLPLGTPVRVLEIHGQNALIALPEGVVAGRVLALGPLADLSPSAVADALAQASAPEAAPVEGSDPDAEAWGAVPLSALDAAEPDLARLLDETEPARIPGALSAALALRPSKPEQLEALRDRALRRDADPLAVAAVARLAAVRAAPASAGELPITVSLTSLFGCTEDGAAESARRVTPSAPFMPSPPQPDIPERAPDEDEDPPTPAGPSQDAALRIAALDRATCLTDVPVFAQCGEAVPVAEWMDDEPPADPEAEARRLAREQRRYDAELAAWAAYHAAHEGWLEALDAGLHQPRLRVLLRNRADQATPAARLLLYSYRPDRDGYCGITESATRADLELHWLDLPEMGPGQALVLWVPSADYGRDYGAFVTASPEEAARFEEALRAEWDAQGGGEPFGLPDWARGQAAQDGPGGDPCGVMACGC